VQKVEGRRKKNSKKKGQADPIQGRRLDRVGLSFIFIFIFIFWGSLGNGLRRLGEWVHSTPIFSSFPLHLEVSNLPFLIEFGDFTSFGFFY
jgi:hypothetical protein